MLDYSIDAEDYLRSVVQPDKPHRAAAVRIFGLDIAEADTVVQLLKSAMPKMTNLHRVYLMSDTVELFEALLEAPPQLRILEVGGSNYPPCFHDALFRQSHLESLRIQFDASGVSATGDEDVYIHLLSDGALLPNIKRLTLDANLFRPSLLKYAFPITCLTLSSPSTEDIHDALKLFSQTLVSLVAYGVTHPSQVVHRSCLPTSLLRDAYLPKLSILHAFFEPDWIVPYSLEHLHVDGMVIRALRGSCPALRTVIWEIDGPLRQLLYGEQAGSGVAPIHIYMRKVFETHPTFVRLAVYERARVFLPSGTLPYGNIWTRANKDAENADRDFIDFSKWQAEALACTFALAAAE
ncbi:hypothetical protein BN946_scf184986.g9 [Trametes cinnabarina]|uniref:F-box domain-containing protein n=1 Tax=Pycnoporus cinnabarinus TaxID=5643 RepID=A0A060SR61_PYCCI|nr:hypothetical protein BN946_scf184986.g9 [Trametes cinnabarina]